MLCGIIPWICIVVWLLKASCDEASEEGKYDQYKYHAALNLEYGNCTDEEDILEMMQDEFDDILEKTPIRKSLVKEAEYDKSLDILGQPLLCASAWDIQNIHK